MWRLIMSKVAGDVAKGGRRCRRRWPKTSPEVDAGDVARDVAGVEFFQSQKKERDERYIRKLPQVIDTFKDARGFGGRGTEKYGKRRENVKSAQSQSSNLLAFVKIQVWHRQVRQVRNPGFDLITTDLLEPFEEPEREFRKRNKKKTKANKVRPRALNFDMGDEAPMWTSRRAAPTVPTNPITKPDLNKEILGKLLHMNKDLTFDGKNTIAILSYIWRTSWIYVICSKRRKAEMMRFAFESFLLHLPEKLELGYDHWSQVQSPLGKDFVQSSFPDFFHHPKLTSYEPRFDPFNKTIGRQYPKHGNIGGRTSACKSREWLISIDFDPSDELAAMKNQQVKFERKIEELIKSVHALQVGCEECNGPHLTKDCPNRPMMTPEEVNYLNRGDYQGRWNNNRNFIPRPPGFFAPNQQTQTPDGEPRLNDEVGSYLRNHQTTIQNLELQVGRVSQLLSERTQGELPTQTQVNPKVENAKPMLMMIREPSKKKWTDIYTKKYVESDSEFVIPKKEDKGKEKEKEKEKAAEDELIYIAPIKHDPGSDNLPISCSKFNGLALIDSGAALNMMPIGYCRKMGVKKIVPTDYQYRGVNGYMTKPLGIAEGVPIRIGNFVYFTDFIIANLPKDTEIPIILGRAFLHTAQVNTDMRNQVTSLGISGFTLIPTESRSPISMSLMRILL
ncbi:hypothetical protein OSB04_002806 [Centaurea solstitialis]|uniref:Retrotransposon gag domain-containing protein n=1 Tax=Centaurea solstitialis TaxID=347529 RepID=A0AA38WTE8_9ASTR|nr:hypothetical protein OSB04_002806 [Centaurea solstitialis]